MTNYEALWNKSPHVVKVWNDNKFPYGPERFKEESIFIKSGGFVFMDANEANSFLGQFHPMELDADGQQRPESYKMLRIERPVLPEQRSTETYRAVCEKCGFIARSKDELDGHVLNNHLDDLEDQDVAKKLAKGPAPKR